MVEIVVFQLELPEACPLELAAARDRAPHFVLDAFPHAGRAAGGADAGAGADAAAAAAVVEAVVVDTAAVLRCCVVVAESGHLGD